MDERFVRTEMLFGTEAIQRLTQARVAVFGVGGVGGYTAEALVRSGVGTLDLIDRDRVSISNINRQIIALQSTVGQPKTELFNLRLHDINPDCQVTVHNVFYLPETEHLFDFSRYDYVQSVKLHASQKLIYAEAGDSHHIKCQYKGVCKEQDRERHQNDDYTGYHPFCFFVFQGASIAAGGIRSRRTVCFSC